MTTAGEVGMVGHPPVVTIGVAQLNPERKKYKDMWEKPEYRAFAPGEHLIPKFMQVVKPTERATIIDFGAGTGRGAWMLAAMGYKVQMLDFAPNCLDQQVLEAMQTQITPEDGVKVLNFAVADLSQPIPYKAKYGYCTDVMEHIPTDQVDTVLNHILMSAQHVFFQISTVDDSCGEMIGETLHMTVQPPDWWAKKLSQFGVVTHYTETQFDNNRNPVSCIFYVSAWQDAKRFVETGELNVTEATCLANMRANVQRGYREARPFQQNDCEVILLAGGPSLNDYVDEIKALRASGAKLVTVNNTYRWALEHDLLPSAQVMVDAREHNKRFVLPVINHCWYLMSSQVHPNVLEALPFDQVILWHTGMESSIPLLNARNEPYYVVPTGSTVVLRAFSLLLMLGYHKFHVFGFDSCLREMEDRHAFTHHAYEQKENDGQHVTPVTCGAKVFYCHPWMVSQAQEFQDLMRVIGEHIDMDVRGDGLIAEIINTAAALATASEFQLD